VKCVVPVTSVLKLLMRVNMHTIVLGVMMAIGMKMANV